MGAKAKGKDRKAAKAAAKNAKKADKFSGGDGGADKPRGPKARRGARHPAGGGGYLVDDDDLPARLGPQGLSIVNAKRDGNCLFHCLGVHALAWHLCAAMGTARPRSSLLTALLASVTPAQATEALRIAASNVCVLPALLACSFSRPFRQRRVGVFFIITQLHIRPIGSILYRIFLFLCTPAFFKKLLFSYPVES
jgi:hypothetical protein